MKIDAKCALDHLKKCHKNAKIILFGQSIGAAVAISLAASCPSKIDALIIENTFLSLVKSFIQSLNLNSQYLFLYDIIVQCTNTLDNCTTLSKNDVFVH